MRGCDCSAVGKAVNPQISANFTANFFMRKRDHERSLEEKANLDGILKSKHLSWIGIDTVQQ